MLQVGIQLSKGESISACLLAAVADGAATALLAADTMNRMESVARSNGLRFISKFLGPVVCRIARISWLSHNGLNQTSTATIAYA